MFPKKPTLVDREIDRLFEKLQTRDSEQYDSVLDKIAKLHKLQADERPQRLSPDTLVLAGTNLLGIVMVLKHEELNVITTKAMSFIIKAR